MSAKLLQSANFRGALKKVKGTDTVTGYIYDITDATFTFGNELDIITDFESYATTKSKGDTVVTNNGDDLDLAGTGFTFVSFVGLDVVDSTTTELTEEQIIATADLADGTVYYAYGSWDEATGIFDMESSTWSSINNDLLVVAGDGSTLGTSDNYILLKDLTSGVNLQQQII